ncbi:MAG: Ig-like domain repeat protein, partial [Casimicrobium sp.]
MLTRNSRYTGQMQLGPLSGRVAASPDSVSHSRRAANRKASTTSRNKGGGGVASQVRNAIFGLIFFVIGLASAGWVSAATFNVNTLSDTHAVTPGAGTGLDGSGNISLRSALETVQSIGGAQTINLPAGTYNLSLGRILFGDVDGTNVTIAGAGAATTIVNMTSTLQDRIFLIGSFGTQANVHTSISNVQFTGGKLTSDNYGGGAIIAGGPNNSLTLTNCIFKNNSVIAGSGLGGAGGAVRYNGGGTLTITGCTFNSNSNSDTAGGAVSYFLENLAGAGSSAASITDSIFTNNSVTTTGGSGGAIHIAAQGRLTVGVTFAVSILRNTFSGNSASGPSGTGGAISVTNSFDVGNTVQVHHNRIVGNTSAMAPSALDSAGGSQGNVSATDNWWGINTGPGTTAAKLGPGGGTLDVSTWLQLKTTASSSALETNQTTPLTTSFLSNSANAAISAVNLTALIGQPVTWSGIGGTVTGQQTTIQAAGTATATYNEATGVAGAHSATAVVDNGPASGSVNTVAFTVNKANVTTTITSDTPDPTVTGQAVSVGYTVVAAQGNSPTAPTGNVQVSDGVNSISGSVAGPASVALFTAGARNLTATYLGDANFNASPASANASHQVNKADTTVTITSDTPNPSNAGQTVTVNYTVSTNSPGTDTPTGSVTVSDGVDSASGTVAGGTASITLNTSGNRTLTAAYAG